MDHISEEISLLGLTEAADSDVRKELFLEDVFGVLDPTFPRDAGLCSANANEIESYVLLLDDKCFVQ